MPQLRLNPQDPTPNRIRITVESFPRTPDPETVHVAVLVTSDPGCVLGGWSGSLHRNERDYLNTLVEAATMAYMYGEGSRDVARACAGVKKLARAHEASTDF